MKRWVLAASLTMTCSSSTMADTIGVSMAHFDDRFLTILREAMAEKAEESEVDIQFVDAKGDKESQIEQVQDFIAEGVDAIIVNPADTSTSPIITGSASSAGIPLVYVNREPEEPTLPERVVYVGSDNYQAGQLQMEELARQMDGKGNLAIMLGELSSSATTQRTDAVKDVLEQYPDIQVVEESSAYYQRSQGANLMSHWLKDGKSIDAVVANNDEMALGALNAMREAGIGPDEILVGGIDATSDALASMEQGGLAVSVFQDAAGQGAGAVDAAVSLIAGKDIDSKIMIPFVLVTRENLASFKE